MARNRRKRLKDVRGKPENPTKQTASDNGSPLYPVPLDIAESSPPDQTFEELKAYYLDPRISFETARLDTIKQFDKFMISLASGALGLSVVFWEKVAKEPSPETLPWIVAAWILFACTLGAVVLSLLLSANAWERQKSIHDIEHHQEVYGENAFKEQLPDWLQPLGSRKNWHINPYNKVIAWLNVVSLVLFAFAVASLLRFAALNLPGPKTTEIPMAEKTTRFAQPTEQRGATAARGPIKLPQKPPSTGSGGSGTVKK